MRSKRPTTYRKWLRERYKVQELGAKAFMTDKMATVISSRYETSRMMANLLAPAFARAILHGGYSLPFKVSYERQRDAYLHGFEHVIVTEHFNEMLPEQYMIKAFDAWNKAYGDLMVWEKKSLWQYLAFWYGREIHPRIQRMFKLIKKKENDYE